MPGGVAAAILSPSALSLVTSIFHEGREGYRALGISVLIALAETRTRICRCHDLSLRSPTPKRQYSGVPREPTGRGLIRYVTACMAAVCQSTSDISIQPCDGQTTETNTSPIRLKLAARASTSGLIAEIKQRFFEDRLPRAEPVVARGIARGELPVDTDPAEVIKTLIAPIYLRLLITAQPIDETTARHAARLAVAARGGVMRRRPD
jgi:hypothetical protein